MQTPYVLCVLAISFLTGVLAASVFSGCQQSEPVAVTEGGPSAASESTPSTETPASESDEQAPRATVDRSPRMAPADSDMPDVKEAAIETVRSAPDTAAEPGDWPQWGGTSRRNNAPAGSNIPTTWNVGEFDRQTGEWIGDEARHIKWVAQLGSTTYGNPVIAKGHVYIGTNNSAGYLKRYPPEVDLGCLLCFRESDGEFLWQHSSEKLASGREHDWELQGICSAPLVEGDRLWFVSSRGHVVCLDTEGFYDGEDDGPVIHERGRLLVATPADKREADTVWSFDMMNELGVRQHNMACCSVTAMGDILFVNTSNGVDESHELIPAPQAPSFIALNKHSGEVYWTDASPGENILHGQWSSPAAGVLGGVPQVIFTGGDGWVYSFRADQGTDGKPEMLWKFDANPKDTEWVLGGRGDRNNIIATPVIYDGRVYVAVGQDPEHGEGVGHLWCIDPTRRGDVSPQLAFAVDGDQRVPLLPRRERAIDPKRGEVADDNPNSAAIWHYTAADRNEDGSIDFEEEMHRALGTVAIKNDLLFVADFSGLFHCVHAKTGAFQWTHDMLAQAWGSPLIVEDHVYIGDEDGDIAVFQLSGDPHVAMKNIDGELVPINADGNGEVVNMDNSVYSSPVVANNVLFIANKERLFAIETQQKEALE
ncbi:MAG: PQQ-binding-like beta-propeller repeat protein [Pirellulaceae bacterium]